jgi:hypothetical protein
MKSPYDFYFFLGNTLLMVFSPIAAVVLNWRLREFLLSFAITSGLLLGNFGYGVVFTLCTAFVYLAVSKVAQVIEFYFPRNVEQDAESKISE